MSTRLEVEESIPVFDAKMRAHDDPFTTREGGKTLVWRDIQMTLAAKGDEPERTLLQDVWGEIRPKETTAVMGPSGAGKTSLLKILAGRASSHGRVKINADIRLNNFVVDPTKITVRKQIAFVARDNSLQVASTPRESIRFSAKLRLPRSMTDHQLDKLTQRMLDELGLAKCADTVVGGRFFGHMPTGECKLTSLGVELVVKPILVFLDEPTFGMNPYLAVQLCQVLKKVANAGASVLFTINPYSQEIFNSLDHLILMNKGRVMYQGSVPRMPEFFVECGHPNPRNYSLTDWIMNVAQAVDEKTLDADGLFPRDERQMVDPFTEEEGKDDLGITITGHHGEPGFDDRRVGALTQVRMLFQRELFNFKRDTLHSKLRVALAIYLGLSIGIICLGAGESDRTDFINVKRTFLALGWLLFAVMACVGTPAMTSNIEERPMFLREYSTDHYSMSAYFLSRLSMEAFITCSQVLIQVILTYFMVGFKSGFGIVFANCYALAMASTAMAALLGCAVEDPKPRDGNVLILLFVPQTLLVGLFVAPDLIPVWLRWAQYLCPLTYSVRIGLIAEFDGTCGPDPDAVETCDRLLTEWGANPDDSWWYWIVLVFIFIVFRFFAVINLRRKASKFF